VKETIKQSLIKTIISNYPVLASHLVHSAGGRFTVSGDRRLRELKQQGVTYTYNKHQYNFLSTPKRHLKQLLKGYHESRN